MNQLVVFFGGIGDNILFYPALKELKHKGRVTVIGYPERLALAKRMGWVDEILSAESVDFHSFFQEPTDRLKQFIRQFDVVYYFLRDSEILIQQTKSMGVNSVSAFPGTPPQNWNRHASEYYLDCLGLTKDKEITVQLPGAKKHDTVIIHPGSGSPRKNMPLEWFYALHKDLVAQGYSVRWCLGPAEAEWEIPLDIEVYIESDLVRLAEYLAGAKCFIGNDSGISHLAGIVGIPTIVIFVSTDMTIWKPLGPHVLALPSLQASIKEFTTIISNFLIDISH